MARQIFTPCSVRPQRFRKMITIQPYLDLMRVGKPTGIWLMFWPFAWGLTLAAQRTRMGLDVYLRSLFFCFIGAFALRSCVCTLNDILDVDFDRQVERCRSRPLPSGRITMSRAVVFFAAQLSICIALLSLLNETAFGLGVIGLFPLHCTYPLLKRWTHWPQAWLGLAMNFGLPVAWTAVTGTLDIPVIGALLLGSWCWTMVYDTIYACQDMKDDKLAGVKSTALLFGSGIRPLLALFAISFIASLAIAGVWASGGLGFMVLSVCGAALHMAWQVATVKLDDPRSCWDMFASNAKLGGLVWAGIATDYAVSLLKRSTTASH